MVKWLCTRCGYIYNEENGDIERGISSNTPFEKLPDSWVCPRCKAEKTFFKKMA
ncbi:rubredoxin [Methanospirillum sp. J.3.6.1-F.2.7.3]|uniref:Rubredoxin n=1 Tax=Methanospirillum purgamenti TaxID=2834276 RepID=A0A8E7AW46_9EURY|nr:MULTISPECIES: rubredoxin [Methanospirillum]MDX8551292.1 rubredoxin [Methanospirillum hungatei]QVV88430.1 rubredoxin [Methanospirillum sp. J.3.6.1-F.2.7.3]